MMKAPRTPRVKTFVETPAALLFLLLLLAPPGARGQEPQTKQAANGAAAAVATPTPKPPPAARSALAGRVLDDSGEPLPEVPVALVPRTSGIRRVNSDYT